MGLTKRRMFEEMQREDGRLEGRCVQCESKLRGDEKGHDLCFDCYCEEQG